AEDGIRDYKVTGVQTCALPILTAGDVAFHAGVERRVHAWRADGGAVVVDVARRTGDAFALRAVGLQRRGGAVVGWRESGRRIARSEERRVGKECRSGWTRDD